MFHIPRFFVLEYVRQLVQIYEAHFLSLMVEPASASSNIIKIVTSPTLLQWGVMLYQITKVAEKLVRSLKVWVYL